MLWNWDTIDACFISSSWHITNNGMFAASCIGVVLLVILLEFFRRLGKEYDGLILRQFRRHVASQTAMSKTEASERSCCSPEAETGMGSRVFLFRATPLQQLIRAFLHAITFGAAYIIMLLAMYYNGYIIICIFVGAGIGKFVCDWMVYKVVVGAEALNGGVADVDEPTVCCG
jgi:copper transporter 1